MLSEAFDESAVDVFRPNRDQDHVAGWHAATTGYFDVIVPRERSVTLGCEVAGLSIVLTRYQRDSAPRTRQRGGISAAQCACPENADVHVVVRDGRRWWPLTWSGVCFRSVERETQLVIAHAEHVTLVDGLSSHALSVELHAVGGAQIDHEIVATQEFHHRMLSRHVWIFDCEIGGLFSAPDDELVFGHGEALSVVIRVD